MALSKSQALKSDESLAIAAQANELAAFEELVGRYQSRLLHFLCQRNDRDSAEDILQETFLAAHQSLHTYRATYRFSTWIFTIAKRRAANFGQPQVTSGECPEEELSSETGPVETMTAREEKTQLWETARQLLSGRQFQALWLFYVEQMSCADIGQVLEVSTATIKMMLSRARKLLAANLAKPEPVTAGREWRKAG